MKKKASAQVSAGVRSNSSWPDPLPILSLILCAIAAVEIGLCLRRHWFAVSAHEVHETVKGWLIWSSLATAGILALWDRARNGNATSLDQESESRQATHFASLATAFAGIFSLIGFLKYCQYRSFQLPSDSTVTANLCWNIAHRLNFASSVLGIGNYFAVHFMPILALLAPVSLIANGLPSLIAVSALALASMPIAAYVLVYRKTGSPLAAAAALWLIFTSPFLMSISTASVVANIFVSIFFVWGVVAFELGYRKCAGLMFLLLAMTIEQSCFVLLGLGLYLIARRERRAGIALCLSSAILLGLELLLRSTLPGASRFPTTTWSLFSNLGPTPKAALAGLVTHPLHMAKLVLWPPARLEPLWNMLSSTGFLPFLQPLSLIPWAFNYLPNFVAGDGQYHSLELHYSSYVIGPLWWSAMTGLIWAHSWLSRKGFGTWLLVYVLLIGALNLRRSPHILASGWNESFYDEIPALASKIPPDASVWAYEFAAPSVGYRPYVKILPTHELDDTFIDGLFIPDYVLMWRTADLEPTYRARLWTFLAQEGYTKFSETFDLILLKHPRAPLEVADGRPPSLEFPAPQGNAPEYGKYLASYTDPSEMLRLWRRAAEAGDAFSQDQLGSAYSQGLGVSKDAQESIRWFRRAADQGYARAQFRLGMCYLSGFGVTKDFGEAANWFRRAAEKGFGPAESSLAQALAEQGRIDEAIEHYRKAISVDPNSVWTYNDLGVLLLQHGRPQEAIEYFSGALKIDPRLDEIEVNLGIALERQGRRADALGHYRRALAINPKNPGARNLIRALTNNRNGVPTP